MFVGRCRLLLLVSGAAIATSMADEQNKTRTDSPGNRTDSANGTEHKPGSKRPQISVVQPGHVIEEKNVDNPWNRRRSGKSARGPPIVIANQTHNRLNKIYSNWVLRGVRKVTNVSAVDEVCTQFFSIGASNQLKYPSMCLTAMPIAHRHHQNHLAKSPNNFDQTKPEYSISLQTCFANVHLALHQLFYMSDGNRVIRPMLHTEWRVVKNEETGFYQLKRDLFEDAPILDSKTLTPNAKSVPYVGPCKPLLPPSSPGKDDQVIVEVPQAEKIKLTERRKEKLDQVEDKGKVNTTNASEDTKKEPNSDNTDKSKVPPSPPDPSDKEPKSDKDEKPSKKPEETPPANSLRLSPPAKGLKAERVSENKGGRRRQPRKKGDDDEKNDGKEVDDNADSSKDHKEVKRKKKRKKKKKKKGGERSKVDEEDDEPEKEVEQEKDDEEEGSTMARSDGDSKYQRKSSRNKKRKQKASDD